MKRWYRFLVRFERCDPGKQNRIADRLIGSGFVVMSEHWEGPDLLVDGSVKIEHAGSLRAHHDRIAELFPVYRVHTKWRCDDPAVWDAEFPEEDV
jgi:hypothetical protein